MVNYNNDSELEEDYKLGWSWLEVDTGPAMKLYLISTCTLLWLKKLTDTHKGKNKEASFIQNFFIPE